jgi:GDPmannose 4,6-dehydratase
MMLQQDEPDDYIIATGESKSIRDFLTAAFSHVGITEWERYVKQDERYFRPAEVDVLRGDFSKATNKFGWEPKTQFDTWVGRMVKNDIYLLENR